MCGYAHIILENWRQTELLQPESKCRSSRCSRILKPLSTGTACDKCVKNLPFHASKKSQINVSTDMETHDRNKENNDPSLIKVQSPSENATLMTLIKEQEKNIKCRPTSRRWSKDTIMSCLSIWRRSKRAYDDLIHSSALVMPSDRLLRLYQNTCEQSPGFHLDIFQWMKDEACRRNIQGAGLEGGILFDEMSIQEDLVLQASGEYETLIGFVNTGEEGDVMRTLCESKTTKTLATHVLQFVFLTFGGFRFPFAHFPTTQIKPFELQYLFWQAVKYLGMYGFNFKTIKQFLNIFRTGIIVSQTIVLFRMAKRKKHDCHTRHAMILSHSSLGSIVFVKRAWEETWDRLYRAESTATQLRMCFANNAVFVREQTQIQHTLSIRKQ